MRKNRVLTQISKIDSEGHKGWLQTQSTLNMYFKYKDVSKTKLTKHNSIELIVPPIGEEKQGLAPKSPKETMKAKLRPIQINKWHKSVNIKYISTHTKLKHAYMCKLSSLLLLLSCSAALQNHNFSCQIVGVRSGKQTQADVIFFTSFLKHNIK